MSTKGPPSITITHPHPAVNGMEKRLAPILHSNGQEFQIAYSLEPASPSRKFMGFVLLVHGFTCAGCHWRPVAMKLASIGYNVLYYDHAGMRCGGQERERGEEQQHSGH